MPQKLLASKVLTPQQETFVRLVTTEGLTIEQAAAHSEVAVSRMTGYNWWKSAKVQDAVRALLEENQQRNQLRATQRLDKAWQTVDKALRSPNVTPTMLKAAVFTIVQANGASKVEAEKGMTFHLEVNTQLNMGALQEQQARHNAPALEGGFTVLDDNGPL